MRKLDSLAYLMCTLSYERCSASQSAASQPISRSSIAGKDDIMPAIGVGCPPHLMDAGFRASHTASMDAHMKLSVACMSLLLWFDAK